MFLLVSVRHVGNSPGEHQHGVSIQISISLGKTFLRISRIQNTPLTWILARVLLYVPPFISQILDFIYWMVWTFILIYFEWHDTENLQYIIFTHETSKRVQLSQLWLRTPTWRTWRHVKTLYILGNYKRLTQTNYWQYTPLAMIVWRVTLLSVPAKDPPMGHR